MSTFEVKLDPVALDVSSTPDTLRVVPADGREIAVPLAWFPRQLKANEEQLNGG